MTHQLQCLIIDDMHESIIPMLKAAGINPDYRPDIKRDEILEIIKDYHGLLVRSKLIVDKEIIDRAVNLKFIGRAGAGLDNIDMDAVKDRNISLLHAPEGNRDAVAEHAVAMLLCLMNKIHVADRQVRDRIWKREENRGIELKNKTVGIIGYGNMGQAFAKRLLGFDCKVLAYDKYNDSFDTQFAQKATMEQIFEEADVVSFHIPLTAETKKMVHLEYIQKFTKQIWLVNTARGEILVLKDLIQALESGKVKGAALDVLENEKFHSLTSEQSQNLENLVVKENIIFSPHVAGWTVESYYKINQVLVEKIMKLLKEEKKA